MCQFCCLSVSLVSQSYLCPSVFICVKYIINSVFIFVSILGHSIFEANFELEHNRSIIGLYNHNHKLRSKTVSFSFACLANLVHTLGVFLTAVWIDLNEKVTFNFGRNIKTLKIKIEVICVMQDLLRLFCTYIKKERIR